MRREYERRRMVTPLVITGPDPARIGAGLRRFRRHPVTNDTPRHEYPSGRAAETTSPSRCHGCGSVGAAAAPQGQSAGGSSAGREQRAPSPAASGASRAQGGGEAQEATANSPDSPPTPRPPASTSLPRELFHKGGHREVAPDHCLWGDCDKPVDCRAVGTPLWLDVWLCADHAWEWLRNWSAGYAYRSWAPQLQWIPDDGGR